MGGLHKRNRQQHQAGKEHVHAITHGAKHLRRKARNDEIPKPVVRRRARLAQTTSLRSELVVELGVFGDPCTYLLRVHLTVDDPWRSVPRRCVKRCPQVEEEYCADASRGKLAVRGRVVRWIGDFDVRGNVPHAHGSSQSTQHEKLGAAEAIDQVQEPENR